MHIRRKRNVQQAAKNWCNAKNEEAARNMSMPLLHEVLFLHLDNFMRWCCGSLMSQQQWHMAKLLLTLGMTFFLRDRVRLALLPGFSSDSRSRCFLWRKVSCLGAD